MLFIEGFFLSYYSFYLLRGLFPLTSNHKGGEQKMRNEYNHSAEPLSDSDTSAAGPVGLSNVFSPPNISAALLGQYSTTFAFSDLPSLLIAPFHFLPRCRQFIQDFLPTTPKKSADYARLGEVSLFSFQLGDDLCFDLLILFHRPFQYLIKQ